MWNPSSYQAYNIPETPIDCQNHLNVPWAFGYQEIARKHGMKITTGARIEVTTLREIRERTSTEFALLASILRSPSQKR